MDSIYLIGADDVRSAGNRMQAAADDMKSAANSLEFAFERQRLFMDDWLARFEAVLDKPAHNVINGPKIGETTIWSGSYDKGTVDYTKMPLNSQTLLGNVAGTTTYGDTLLGNGQTHVPEGSLIIWQDDTVMCHENCGKWREQQDFRNAVYRDKNVFEKAERDGKIRIAKSWWRGWDDR